MVGTPKAQFSEVDPKPDSGGDALMMPVAGKAARPIGGVSIVTAKVVNDVADYPQAA